MSGFTLCMVGLTVLASGLLAERTMAAEAKMTVKVTPSHLTVAGTCSGVETRTLILSAGEPVTGLKVIPLDLVRVDGNAIFPAKAISPKLSMDQLKPNEPLTVPVEFDLGKASSGEFSGALLITYQSGELTVPVTVRLKAPWLWPLIVLITGVVLGMGVSAYRARGRPRDEVLVRAGKLRTQMRTDANLAEPFRARIEAALVDMETALQAEQWEDARRVIERAETVWGKWRKGHGDWLEQLAYQAQLVRQMEDLGADVPYVQAVRRGLEDAARSAPDMECPVKLREQLDALGQQINRYLLLHDELQQLNALRNHLPTDQNNTWRLKAQAFERRLNALPPSDQQAYEALHAEVGQALTALTELVSHVTTSEIPSAGARGLGTMALRMLPSPPSVRPLEEQLSAAHSRLWLFTWVSYGVAVALLAGAGFVELYIARPTFGANSWGDYFALLAWGFGAEATRTAVMEVVRDWELPGFKKAQ
jgi:hypothetical protein